MSKIVVDEIQKSGGVALTLPAADGSSGDTLQTDGSGNLSFGAGATEVQTCTYSKAFSLTGSSYATSNRIMWTDVKSGISTDDIIMVRIEGKLVATTNYLIRMMGANASGNPITSGYLGAGWQDSYNGGSATDSNRHNSNNGYIDFPGYTTAYGTNSDTYGYGIAFVYEACIHKYGNSGGHLHRINYWYQQDTSYDYPNHGMMAWNNYASNTPPTTWHGIHIYPNSGSWDTSNNNNVVSVTLTTNNA
ncbi:MAG: hypothetical protein CMO44_18940 [Verrucomicrobiales bacterium]|nr:hypothetical protein [Verrucomicrobiales bacterium]